MSATLPPTEDQISAIVSDYVDEARRDYVGLWQISIRVRRDFNTKSEAENKKIVLKIVDKMLQNGLEAVTLVSSGPGCIRWKDQEATSILSRISNEWDRLGRSPSVGEIVWFDNPDTDKRN